MKCPHCKKKPDYEKSGITKASVNAEFYGSRGFTLKCDKCGGKFKVYACRKVVVTMEGKAKEDEDLSFGQFY